MEKIEQLIAQYPETLQTFFKKHINFNALQKQPTFNPEDLITSIAFGCNDDAVKALLLVVKEHVREGLLSKHSEFDKSFVWALLAKHPGLFSEIKNFFYGVYDECTMLLAGKMQRFQSILLAIKALPAESAVFLIELLRRVHRVDSLKMFMPEKSQFLKTLPGLVHSISGKRKLDESVVDALIDWVFGLYFCNKDIAVLIEGENHLFGLRNTPNFIALITERYSINIVRKLSERLNLYFDLTQVWDWWAHSYSVTNQEGKVEKRSGFFHLLARHELGDIACEIMTRFAESKSTMGLFRKNFYDLFFIPYSHQHQRLMIHLLIRGVAFVDVSEIDFGAINKLLPPYRWLQAVMNTTSPDSDAISKFALTDEIRGFRWPDDETLLHIAVRLQKTNWVLFLLKHGWSRMCFDKRGQLPIHRALQANYEGLKAAFLSDFHEDWLKASRAGETSLALLLRDPLALTAWFSKVNKDKAWPVIDKVMRTIPFPSTLDFKVLFHEASLYYPKLAKDDFITHSAAFIANISQKSGFHSTMSLWLSNLSYAQRKQVSEALSIEEKSVFDEGLARRIQEDFSTISPFKLDTEMSLLSPHFRKVVAKLLLLKSKLYAVSVEDLKYLSSELGAFVLLELCNDKPDIILLTLASVSQGKWVPAFAGMTGLAGITEGAVLYRVLSLIDKDPLKKTVLTWLVGAEGKRVKKTCGIDTTLPLVEGSVWQAMILEQYATSGCDASGISRLSEADALHILVSRFDTEVIEDWVGLLFSHPMASVLFKKLYPCFLISGANIPGLPSLDEAALPMLKLFWRYVMLATQKGGENDPKSADARRVIEQILAKTCHPDYMLAIKQQLFILQSAAFLKARDISALTALLDESELSYDSNQLQIIFETLQSLPNSDASIAYLTQLLSRHDADCIRQAINRKSINALPWVDYALMHANHQQLLVCLLFVLKDDDSLYKTLREKISARDTTLIPTPYLKGIISEVLAQKSSLLDLTFDGVWILRLLMSPRFVAEIEVKVMTALIERFRLISLTLKKDEYQQLSRALKSESTFSKGLLSQDWKTWARLKQRRLMQFQADDTIRVVLNRLEEAAMHLQNTKALAVMAGYLAESVNGMQNSRLFRLSNALMSKASSGDLAKQSHIYQWLATYLPHDNFMQQELRRMDDSRLFDAQGQEIGFIQEGNQALVWSGTELLPLRPKYPPNTELYDDKKRKLGQLSADNVVVFENVFQAKTSMNLIMHVPSEVLAQGPVEFELLINDVLRRGMLTALYGQIKPDKKQWLTGQMAAIVGEAKASFDEASFNVWIANGGDWLSLLSKMSEADACFKLLHRVLNHETLNPLCVENKSLWQHLSNRFGKGVVLFELLSQHTQDFWLYALFLGLDVNAQAMTAAFDLLVKAIDLNQFPETVGDNVLIWLLSAPKISAWVLRHLEMPLLKYFSKKHIMPTLELIGRFDARQKDPRFKLLSIIVERNFMRLFPDDALRYAKDSAWYSEDIALLHRFVMMSINDSGHTSFNHFLWRTVVFYAANFSMTSIFFDANGALSKENLTWNVASKTSLEHGETAQVMVNALSGVGQLYDYLFKSSIYQARVELDKNFAILHWRDIREKTFNVWPKPSSLQVFLLNYAGEVEPVKTFLTTVLKDRPSKKVLQDLSAFLTTFPNKDISRLIYLALEDFYCQHPQSLDDATFKVLAQFYEPDDKKDLLKRELALIYRWGHKQHYQLVHQACRLLHPDKQDELSKTVKQIAAEARAESSLNPLMGKRFFSIIASIKRLWYCGIWGYRTPTFYVRRCNDKENDVEVDATKLPERVRTSALPGKIVEQQIAYLEKTKRLQAMVNRIC